MRLDEFISTHIAFKGFKHVGVASSVFPIQEANNVSDYQGHYLNKSGVYKQKKPYSMGSLPSHQLMNDHQNSQ